MALFLLAGRRFFAPEIVQTSATDCGPAALASVLAGHGISADYARLREACQTSVDGTSIDTLEEIAQKLGLNAAQYIQRPEDLLRAEAKNFPSLLVTRLPEGGLHFVVAWRRAFDFIQIMDPGSGRSWIRKSALERMLHVHEQTIAAEDWHEFAAHGPFESVLRRRLEGLLGANGGRELDRALESRDWSELASLDSAARLLERLSAAGVVRGRPRLSRAFERLRAQARLEAGTGPETIPDRSWSVRPRGSPSELSWTGAVALRLLGKREAAPETSLEPELRASVTGVARSPLATLLALLPSGRVTVALLLGLSALIAVFGVVAQGLAVRALLSIDQVLLLSRQRLLGLGLYAGLLALLLAADLVTQGFLLRAGRRLEARLWAAILEKVPKLPERYFKSRLLTDLADRAQSVQHLRRLPGFVYQALRLTLDLALTVVVLALADRESLPLAGAAFVLTLFLPLVFGPLVSERDLRLRTHQVALSRFLFDALLGAMPARSHRAERALKREQEGVLVEWARSARSAVQVSVALGAVQALSNAGFLILLLFGYVERHGALGGGLLVVLYWGGRLPLLGQELVGLLREYPVLQNVAARLVEPLNAPEETPESRHARITLIPSDQTHEIPARPARPAPGKDQSRDAPGSETRKRGARIQLEDVSVRVSGKTLLEDIKLEIPGGSHVAVVGRSGAGKSTLLGLLLGFHQHDGGRLRIDGEALTPAALERLRPDVAWVDPAVQLWNRSLIENVRYGSVREPSAARTGQVIADAALIDALERLPEGMQTDLGEGGRLLSGGEGQRVRHARALLRPNARLVLLDEPFRGLERGLRSSLLSRARSVWSRASLLCVTHDIAETADFDRVLVLEDGRIAEDGRPQALLADPSSLYARLFQAERATLETLATSERWRRLEFSEGRLVPKDPPRREEPK